MKTKTTANTATGGTILSPALNAFTRGKRFFMRHKRAIMIAALLGAVALLVVPHLAFAQDPVTPPKPVSSPEIDKMYREITKFITFLLEFLQRLLWPIMLLIGGLMKNDILFGAGMEDRMLAIWVQIRNFVNILFVMVLLGIAFYNVVGGSDQGFQLKQILPKFVIGLIAVNFSFIGVKILIDTVNVATIAIFALPNSVQDGLGDMPMDESGQFNKNFTMMICEGIYGDTTVYKANIIKAQEELTKAGSDSEPLCTEGRGFTGTAQRFFAKYDAHNAGIVMAVNLSKITDWGKVNKGVTDFKGLAMNSLFAITLFIVFATSYVALFVILLIRLIVLWVTLVLSPLIVLTYVLPENIASTMGGGDLKKKFMQNIIAPLPIALMMTIGFMMLKGINESKFSTLSNVTLNTSSISMGLFTTGLSTLQELIVAVGTIAVIWMGVFQAAKGGFAEKIVGQIEEGVKGVGKFAASSFKYAPIFPVSGAKTEDGKPLKMSLAGALGMGDALQQGRSEQVRKETADAMKSFKLSQGRPFADAIAGASSTPEFRQKLMNAKAANLEDTEGIQKAIAAADRKIPSLRRELIFVPNMKGKSGEIKQNDWATLFKEMEAGTIEAESMRRFAAKNTENLQAEKETKQEGKDQKGSTEDEHNKAKNAITAAGANEQLLTDPAQKKAVQDYRTAMEGKDEKKQAEALKALQESKAIDSLEGIATQRNAFITQAERAKDGASLNDLILKRKKELTDAKVANPDEVLRADLESAIKHNSAVVEEAKKDSKEKGTDAIFAATPAKPAEVKDYAAPAAGKKPAAAGTGSGKTPPPANKWANSSEAELQNYRDTSWRDMEAYKPGGPKADPAKYAASLATHNSVKAELSRRGKG